MDTDKTLEGFSYQRSSVSIGGRSLGAVAQLGERLICIQEVAGSIPTSSTSLSSMGELLPSLVGPVAQLVRAHP